MDNEKMKSDLDKATKDLIYLLATAHGNWARQALAKGVDRGVLRAAQHAATRALHRLIGVDKAISPDLVAAVNAYSDDIKLVTIDAESTEVAPKAQA